MTELFEICDVDVDSDVIGGKLETVFQRVESRDTIFIDLSMNNVRDLGICYSMW